MSAAVLVSFARTPVGTFQGALSGLSATQLGAAAVKEALRRSKVPAGEVEEVFLGNVLSAGLGQAPARQAALAAGLPETVPCTTVNKVCASGMKSLMLASQSIELGRRGAFVAGGMESLSNAPYYVMPPVRSGLRMGHGRLVDGMLHDGLWDVYNDQHMGMCGEACASKFGISRQDQDEYAIESYRRAAAAWEGGMLAEEVFPMEVQNKRVKVRVDKDDEVSNIELAGVTSQKPAFLREGGTVTAANSSTLNDGAAVMIMMSEERAKELGVAPLARILGYADAARSPVEFTIAPSDAIPLALGRAGVSKTDIGAWEINEAFAVVALANMRLLDLPHDKLNVHGGAVAIGHPLGSSGARIIGSLLTVLKNTNTELGCAAICNGGGGASAVVIQRLC